VDEGKVDPDGSGYDVLWTYLQAEKVPFNGSAALVGGNLVLVTQQTRVIALNTTNGTIAWEVGMGERGPITSDIIAINGSVIVAGRGVHILSIDAGVETWTYEGTASTSMVGTPAALDDMLFVMDKRGIVYAFGKVKNIPPIARISTPQENDSFRINESVTFDASATTDDKTLPDSAFYWDFGDGNHSLSKVTSHRYPEEGIYKVVLTVTDTDGAMDNTSINIRILGNHDPILDWWDVTPDTGTALVTPFNFSVRYTDPDNDPPEFIVLRLVDEPEYQPLTMQEVDPVDEDYTDGKEYYFIQPLASRPYPAVSFRASDGISSTELVIGGPTVLMERTFPNSVGDIEVTVTYVGPHSLEYHPPSSTPNPPTSLHPINVFTELYLNTTYLQQASISINYSLHDVEGMDLSTLAVYRWLISDTDAEWDYLRTSTVDLERGTVTALIPSLDNDLYTVLGNMVNPPPNHPPVAVIAVDGRTYSPGANVETTYNPGEAIEFDASSSYDPDEVPLNDEIVDYTWTFGDGSSVEKGKLANHQYELPDKYTVTLVVRDEYGVESQVSVIVTVRTQEESNLLYIVVIIGIIIILLLLFWPKGSNSAPPKGRPQPPRLDKPHEPPRENGTPKSGVDGGETEVEETSNGAGEDKTSATELDDIIDELEEDRVG
jgi:PKD repeat protein